MKAKLLSYINIIEERAGWWWSVSLILLSFNFLFLHSSALDVIFFIFYFILTGFILARILKKILLWSDCLTLSFSYFIVLYLFSFAVGAFVDFYKLTDIFLILSLGIVGGAILLTASWPGFRQVRFDFRDQLASNGNDFFLKPPKYLLLSLPFLFVVSIWLLFVARTGDYIITPWQAISKIYIYIFLSLTLTVWLLVFSKLKIKAILLIIILHSFLVHAYLPIVYETGFGGDKWRHLASEEYLLQEKVYSPVLIGEKINMIKLGPVSLPEVLVAGNKTSYGNQWGITIALSKFLHIDIFWIDYLLLFFIWSTFLPFFLYKFGELIYNKKRFRLTLAFLPTVFYTLQVFGAITIPVSYGGLFFLFTLYLWLKYLRDGKKQVAKLALLFSVLMYLGYILYFILIIEVAIMVFALRLIKKQSSKIIAVSVLLLLFILLVPALEILMGYGSLKSGALTGRGILNNTADAFGTISGLVAFVPRPTHIDQGNWLYNQTRQTQSEASLFSLRFIPLIFTVFIWGVILLGIKKLQLLKNKKITIFLGVGLLVLLGNYIISWYFMDGNHILARRLDLTIVFLLVVFLSLGIFYLLENIFIKLDKNFKVWTIGMALALVATSTYASGPVLEVVTKDEVEAAQYVWENIDKASGKYCVVANTWPLLALEYSSAREIIAGGFPVYLEYAQPERVKIFEGLIRKPTKDDWMAKAFDVTQAKECWYMLEKRWVSDKVWDDNIKLFGDPQFEFSKVYVWQIKKGL